MKLDGIEQSDPFDMNIEQDAAFVVSRRDLSRRAILDFDLAPSCTESGLEYIDRGYHRAVLPMLIAWVPICVVTALTPILVYLSPLSTGVDPVSVLIALIIGFSILCVAMLIRWGSRRSRGSRVLTIDAHSALVSLRHTDGLPGQDVHFPVEDCIVATHVVLFNGHRGFATAITVDDQLFLLSIHFRRRAAMAYQTALPPLLKVRLRRGPTVIVKGSLLGA